MAVESMCKRQRDSQGDLEGQKRELPDRVMAVQSIRSSGSCEDQFIHI